MGVMYGGEIDCILENLTLKSLDRILDLIDEYIDLVEDIKKMEGNEHGGAN